MSKLDRTVASPSDPLPVARATLPYVWAVAAVAVGLAARSMADHPHFVRTKGRTVIEIRSEGPFAITYVNPTDDPRKAPMP